MSSIPHTPLFHYTGEAALRGILGHRKLRCFIHNRQSDLTEVEYSFGIATKVLKEEASRNHGHAQSLLLGLDDMLGNNPMSNTFDFYFFSLSTHRDHVNQWSGYGDKGCGFSIGFSSALFQPVHYSSSAALNFFPARTGMFRHQDDLRQG
jgi:hypothetical protein